jgi:transposase-like protein
MPRYRSAYPPEFRRQMIDLVRSGRTPEDLAREFEHFHLGEAAIAARRPAAVHRPARWETRTTTRCARVSLQR